MSIIVLEAHGSMVSVTPFQQAWKYNPQLLPSRNAATFSVGNLSSAPKLCESNLSRFYKCRCIHSQPRALLRDRITLRVSLNILLSLVL